jgi:hypothetical protein
MAFAEQDPVEGIANAGVIFDQQNFCRTHELSLGSMTPKVVPWLT